MSQPNKPIAHIYNPLNQDRQALIDSFVIRKKELNRIMREIRTSDLDLASQNFIIQGQRGTGKTTLLGRLKYAIEDDGELSHLIPVQFSEEQYNIFSLNRLWENVADILEEEPGFETLVPDMEEEDDDEDFFYLIKRLLKQNGKKLVLLIDNFGDILDKLPEKAHKQIRDLLHETDLQIIAGSTRALDTTYKHDKPFFESFKTIMLSPLSSTDVQVLLKNLCHRYQDKKAFQILKEEKGRIEAIRRLTGGVPRTIILLFEIFLDDSANVFEDLEGILDKITPLYKHKMDDLPTQQQVIVDAIALHWDGMLASEIAKKIKIETKKVSAQMKLLEKSGFIRSVLINKKNKLYMLDERFFNIWYLMRYGRKKKRQQVRWLVSFLSAWCTQEDLLRKAEQHIELAKARQLHERGGYYMADALSQAVSEPLLQYEVLSQTRAFLEMKAPNLATDLPDEDEQLYQCSAKAYSSGDFEHTLQYLEPLAKKGNIHASYVLIHLLYIDGVHDRGQKHFTKAVETDYQNDLGFLLNILFPKQNNSKAKELFSAFKKYADTASFKHLSALAVMAIHCNEFTTSMDYFKQFLSLAERPEKNQAMLTNYIILMLARKQYYLAMELFKDKTLQLKEMVRPVYYTLISFMQDEYPKEYKRMGSELQETVDEIVERIKNRRKLLEEATKE